MIEEQRTGKQFNRKYAGWKNSKHIEKSDLRRRSNISYWYSRSREKEWKKKVNKRKRPKIPQIVKKY